MLRAAVDQQRQTWAKDPQWLYFGNNPKPVSQPLATRAFEAEMWALWIISEDYYFSVKYSSDPLITQTTKGVITGNSGLDIEPVLDRLIDLGVMNVRTDEQFEKRSKAIAKALEQRAQKARPRFQPGGGKMELGRCYDSTVEGIDLGPNDLSLGGMDRRRAEEARAADLLPVELFGIEGDLDTKEEFESLQKWLANRTTQGQLEGRISYTPRYLRPIDPANL
jgi:hypothetical protein